MKRDAFAMKRDRVEPAEFSSATARSPENKVPGFLCAFAFFALIVFLCGLRDET